MHRRETLQFDIEFDDPAANLFVIMEQLRTVIPTEITVGQALVKVHRVDRYRLRDGRSE